MQILGQQERILRFTNVVRHIGGTAHELEAWEQLLRSNDLFDLSKFAAELAQASAAMRADFGIKQPPKK